MKTNLKTFSQTGKISTRVFFVFLTLFILNSCKSVQNQLVGKWKLISIIESDNPYATRSSLTPKKIESKMILILKKDGKFDSNGEYCFDGIKRVKPSSGRYYMKKHNRLDKLYTFESSECPGIGSDLFFSIRDKNLELQLPSVTGYRIQVFEKIK